VDFPIKLERVIELLLLKKKVMKKNNQFNLPAFFKEDLHKMNPLLKKKPSKDLM